MLFEECEIDDDEERAEVLDCFVDPRYDSGNTSAPELDVLFGVYWNWPRYEEDGFPGVSSTSESWTAVGETRQQSQGPVSVSGNGEAVFPAETRAGLSSGGYCRPPSLHPLTQRNLCSSEERKCRLGRTGRLLRGGAALPGCGAQRCELMVRRRWGEEAGRGQKNPLFLESFWKIENDRHFFFENDRQYSNTRKVKQRFVRFERCCVSASKAL